MVDLLSSVKPLEKLIGYSAKSKEDEGSLISSVIESVELQRSRLKDYFKNALPENKNYSDFIDEMDRKLERLVQLCQYLVEKFKSGGDYQKLYRDLLRNMINGFEELQADISISQRSFSNLFSIANTTNTTTTQQAYYDVQNHVFSAQGCSGEQLWVSGLAQAPSEQSESTAGEQASLPVKKRLDTSQYSGIRQKDALFAACLIEAEGKVGEAQQKNQAARKKIKSEHKSIKQRVDQARGGGCLAI